MAKCYKLFLRGKAALGFSQKKLSGINDWILKEFVSDQLPMVESAAALIGTPDPAQKITIQLLDIQDNVIGYLKYAEKKAACKRLKHEYRILSSLPSGLGPVPIKFGSFGNGLALLILPLNGEKVKVTLPPPIELVPFLQTLILSQHYSLDKHPWLNYLKECGQIDLDKWLEPLSGRDWPITILHGDMTPWNMVRLPDNNYRLFDWEYGSVEGFPYIDMAYYMLQVGALIYRFKPEKAYKYAEKFIISSCRCLLTKEETQSIIKLAAYSAINQALEDGHSSDEPLQCWRYAIINYRN
jgi:hypothetical protein